jgi:hypothetical protein
MKISNFYFAAFFLFACSCDSHKKEFKDAEALAHQYCQSCHLFPSPQLLDKRTWVDNALPAMAARMNVDISGSILSQEKSPMSKEEWDKIVQYFYTLAPDSLKRINSSISNSLTQFNYKATPYRSGQSPVTTMVKIDPATHSVYICDGLEFNIKIFDKDLNQIGSAPTYLAVSSITLDTIIDARREATLLNMGTLNPLDVTSGRMQKLSISKDNYPSVQAVSHVDSLERPVFFEHDDLTNDGIKDYLISGFGNFKGSLLILKTKKNGAYEKIILRNQPGAMQTRLIDVDKDGNKDVVALMAQADEGIFLYKNKKNGEFEEKRLLSFSPVYGSTSFDLADFNGDGFPDIVYTAGDNSDYSRILKPYHGVYIYLNDGNWNFKEEYFFPINGCFKVIARDFDEDGDIDLATISFFSDLKNRPQEGFVYFKNDGNMDFETQTFPQVMEGHWLTMDAQDIDGDEDIDIVLGNMSIGPSNIKVKNNWTSGPAFILLENKVR